MMSGEEASNAIGAKARSGSKSRFLYMNLLLTIGPTVPMKSV
jgi:hypothetical protein